MLELAKMFQNSGQDVVLIYSKYAQIASRFEDLGVPSLVVDTFKNAMQAVMGLWRLPRISKSITLFLEANKVTSIVVPMEQVWQSFLSRSYGAKWPVLLFVHDAEAHFGEGSVLKKIIANSERRHASGAMTLSNHAAALLRSSRIFPADKIWTSIHPAFIANIEYSRVRSLPKDHVPVVGFFGRMVKYKGLDLGLKSIDILRKRGYQVMFSIVGEGVQRDLPYLSDSGNIVDDRWVPEDEIQTVLNSFDILLLPYIEASQSGVFAYAMSLGIPTVVTPVGGLLEQAEASQSSLIATEVSANALADDLERLITEEGLYSALSASALKSSQEFFSWKRLASDTLEATREISKQ